jgi:hypothetical protein
MEAARPELPVDAHFLLISWSTSAETEIKLHAWGMRQLMAEPELDVSYFAEVDPDWGVHDTVQIVPEEMATEDLLRIWDALPAKYTLSSSWVARTIRIALPAEPPRAPVGTRVLPMSVP